MKVRTLIRQLAMHDMNDEVAVALPDELLSPLAPSSLIVDMVIKGRQLTKGTTVLSIKYYPRKFVELPPGKYDATVVGYQQKSGKMMLKLAGSAASVKVPCKPLVHTSMP